MKICKIRQFFRRRSRNNIPYTNLVPMGTKISTEIPLPSPFEEMKQLKKPKGGKLTSLGIISVGISLAGLIVLMEDEREVKKQSVVLEQVPIPPRPQSV